MVRLTGDEERLYRMFLKGWELGVKHIELVINGVLEPVDVDELFVQFACVLEDLKK